MQAYDVLDQADAMLLEKRNSEAEAFFREACKLDPTCYQAMNNIGAILISRRDYAGARDYFLQADELVDLPMIQNNLKILARQIGS